jgi:hypothetical protein
MVFGAPAGGFVVHEGWMHDGPSRRGNPRQRNPAAVAPADRVPPQVNGSSSLVVTREDEAFSAGPESPTPVVSVGAAVGQPWATDRHLSSIQHRSGMNWTELNQSTR